MLIYKIKEDNLINSTFDEYLSDKNSEYWMIMTSKELEMHNEHFNYNYQTIYDCIYNKDTPKLDVYENYSFGILNIIGESDNFFDIIELNFFITSTLLIFISDTDILLFNEVKDFIKLKSSFGLSLEKILYTLLDKISANDNKVLSELEVEITNVELEVIEGKTRDYINDIVLLKNKLLFLKKHYEPLLDLLEDLTENANNILGDKYISYFVILFNRIERLNRKVSNLRDYTTQIRESYQAQLDINANNIMKLLTVITAFFSPLTLIVGWYGMNFSNMPEYSWKHGYLYVAFLSILVTLFCVWLFKKKRYM